VKTIKIDIKQKLMNEQYILYSLIFKYCGSIFIRRHRFSWFLQNALIHGFFNSWFQTLQATVNGKIVFR